MKEKTDTYNKTEAAMREAWEIYSAYAQTRREIFETGFLIGMEYAVSVITGNAKKGEKQ